MGQAGKGASIRNEQIEEVGGEGEGIGNKQRVGRSGDLRYVSE